jgi:hypothetical protein
MEKYPAYQAAKPTPSCLNKFSEFAAFIFSSKTLGDNFSIKVAACKERINFS